MENHFKGIFWWLVLFLPPLTHWIWIGSTAQRRKFYLKASKRSQNKEQPFRKRHQLQMRQPHGRGRREMASCCEVWLIGQRSRGLMDSTEVFFFWMILSIRPGVSGFLGDGLSLFLYKLLLLSSLAKGAESCPYCLLLPPLFILHRIS